MANAPWFEAMIAGGQAGHQRDALWAQQEQEALRIAQERKATADRLKLAYDQLRSNESQADKRAQQQQQLALAHLYFQQQQQDAVNAYRAAEEQRWEQDRQERNRHNIALESTSGAKTTSQEEYRKAEQAERARHNAAIEKLAADRLVGAPPEELTVVDKDGEKFLKRNGKFYHLPNAQTPMDTITEKIPGVPEKAAVEASNGIFGIGKHPGSPAVPAVPERRITRRIPSGAIPSALQAPALVPGSTTTNAALQSPLSPPSTSQATPAVEDIKFFRDKLTGRILPVTSGGNDYPIDPDDQEEEQ